MIVKLSEPFAAQILLFDLGFLEATWQIGPLSISAKTSTTRNWSLKFPSEGLCPSLINAMWLF